MSIRGKFFPVGHGLTYAFKIGRFHLLFDIRKKCNFTELENFFDGKKEIDIMVISHFDVDHSDGIQKIRANGYKIKKVYIPYIGDDERLLLELIFAFTNRNFNNMLEDLGDVEIVEVRENEAYRFLIGKLDFWEFNVHNSAGNAPTVVKKILSELSAIGIQTNDDVRRNLHTKQAQIKQAYQNAVNNLNITSMFMDHGPIDESMIGISVYSGMEFTSQKREFSFNASGHFHSLITGDCNIAKNQSIVQRYADRLAYALVPHHSGIGEWNDCLCRNTDKVDWIVTISKIGVRPYGKVVSDIYSNDEKLFICDEKQEFEYLFITSGCFVF